MNELTVALWEFWSSFGIPAYAFNQIPDNAQLPYILYNIKSADCLTSAYDNVNVYYGGKYSMEMMKMLDKIHDKIDTGLILPIGNRGNIQINEITFQPLPTESDKVDTIGYVGQFLINYNLF